MTRLLLPYWLMTGQFTEGRRWHDLALAVAPGSRDDAWAVFGAGVLAVQQGDFATGGPLLTRATALAAASGGRGPRGARHRRARHARVPLG